MSGTEWFTIALAAISLAISVWAALGTNRISSHDLRLARRLELHALLQDADRELLHDPSLFRMFKSNPTPHAGAEPPSAAKQEAYFLLYMNTFEAAHSIFAETKWLSPLERQVDAAWARARVSFLEDCIPAVEIWAKRRDDYYDSFRTAVDATLGRLNRSVRPARDESPPPHA